MAEVRKNQAVNLMGGMIDKTDVYEAAFILAYKLLNG